MPDILVYLHKQFTSTILVCNHGYAMLHLKYNKHHGLLLFGPCLLLCYIPLDLASVEMDENDLEMLRPIGKGQFGKVFKGLSKGLQVAIKEIPKGYGKPDLTEIDVCR